MDSTTRARQILGLTIEKMAATAAPSGGGGGGAPIASSKPIYGPKKPPGMGKTMTFTRKEVGPEQEAAIAKARKRTMTFTPKETAGDAEYYDKMRKTRIGRSRASPAKAKPGPWQRKWRARQRQKAGGKGIMTFTRKEVVPEQEAAIAKARRNRGS
jgi:hypothetical protein